MTAGWTYSPDPRVESAVARIARDHPPLFPDGFARCYALLDRLGNPHLSLPPVFHAAGTNGKGSVLAFLRAALEAGGLRAHVFTSPHLVRFEERIAPCGVPLRGEELEALVGECAAAARDVRISFFEFFTVLGLLAFARRGADALLLETGLGGLHDATNVVEKSVAVITRVSLDHTRILGPAVGEIAAQKAGIIKPGCPVILAAQESPEAEREVARAAREKGARLYCAGRDWSARAQGDGFVYESAARRLDLPLPALPGAHQVDNAGAALAALEQSCFSFLLDGGAARRAMACVSWPGRLQRLARGPAAALLPPGWELWLDGAHNDSGAQALLAHACACWDDGKPLHLVTMMKKEKDAGGFYGILRPRLASVQVVDAALGAPMMPAAEVCALARGAGVEAVETAENLESAVRRLVFQYKAPQRILVAGSLYFAGHVLRTHG